MIHVSYYGVRHWLPFASFGIQCACQSAHLLWGHVIGHGPEIHVTEGVDARQDEEDAGTARAPLEQPAETKYHGPLVLLHHL